MTAATVDVQASLDRLAAQATRAAVRAVWFEMLPVAAMQAGNRRAYRCTVHASTGAMKFSSVLRHLEATLADGIRHHAGELVRS